MAFKGGQPQSKPGYPQRTSSNPNKPARKSQEPDRLPSIADQDPAGNKITTNYPVKESVNKERKVGGAKVEGMKLRGYIHNESARKFSTESGNARRGSPPTVRPISGPDLPSTPTPSQKAAGKRGGPGGRGD